MIVEAAIALGKSAAVKAAIRSVREAINRESRVDKLRKVQQQYGADSPEYRAAARKYPKAAARREKFQMAKAAKGKLTKAARRDLARLLKPVPEFKGYGPAQRRAVLRGRAGRVAGSLARAAGPYAAGLLGILYPSAITKEVPIPKAPQPAPPPSGGPPTRPGRRVPPPSGDEPDWYEAANDAREERARRGQGESPPSTARPGGSPVTVSPVIPSPAPAPAPPTPATPPKTRRQIIEQILQDVGTAVSTYQLIKSVLPTGGSGRGRRQPTAADPFVEPVGLTATESAGVPYGPSRPCEPAAKKKRGKRKRRTVCYRGTYTETATGLTKRKREKVPCQSSRKKRQ